MEIEQQDAEINKEDEIIEGIEILEQQDVEVNEEDEIIDENVEMNEVHDNEQEEFYLESEEENNIEMNEIHNDEQEDFYLESEEEEEENDEITSDDEIEDDAEVKEILELQTWAIQNNIPHTVLDSLLKILKNRLLPTLPMSAKTFLKTTSVRFNIEQFPLCCYVRTRGKDGFRTLDFVTP